MQDETSTTTDTQKPSWIDIGNHELVRVAAISAVTVFDWDDDATYFTNTPPDVTLIKAVVHTSGGGTYASSLNWRELRNRLRKAGHEVLS